MNLISDYRSLLMRLTTKQSYVLAMIAGGLATLSLPPFSFWPALIPAFCTLFWLWLEEPEPQSAVHRQQQRRRRVWILFFFQLSYHVTSLYWIAFALGVDIKQFLWLVPLAVLALPALMAFYAFIIARIFNRVIGSIPHQWLLFACIWSLSELLRSYYLFTGFPWNLIGYGWIALTPIIQATAVFGIYGLSFLTILIVTMPVLIADKSYKSLTSIALVALIIIGGGIIRLYTAENSYIENVFLRLVQPSIPQHLKYDSQHREANFSTLLKLSQQPAQQPVTHIIWPEAAAPWIIELYPQPMAMISGIAPENGYVILGTTRAQVNHNKITALWNGMIAIDAHNNVVAHYNKNHLVPFGEYIPMRSLWPQFVKKVTLGMMDYSAGTGLQTLNLTGTPTFSPLICYEAIFPGNVVAEDQLRPKWLLNLTNDAWYGNTSGPPQHLAITRVRAIEEGLPLIRVANNGISAVIDPWGRVLQSLPLNQQGVIDSRLPKSLSKITMFGRYGNKPFFIFLAVLTCMLISTSFMKREHD